MKRVLREIDNLSFHRFIIIVLIIFLMITVILISGINYINKTKCLTSDIPRRWHSGICEQYEGGEWIQINPYNADTVYYNEAAEGLK